VTSPVAGTTRDVLSAEVALGRGMVRLLDVAGLDAAPGVTADPIERQMRGRALRAAAEADVVVIVHDVTDAAPPPDVGRPADVVVRTKSDLLPPGTRDDLAVSARTGDGLPALRERLDRVAFGDRSTRPSLALNARHVAAVEEARAALARVSSGADASPEVVALELREALDALGRVVGAVTPDDLLGRIFSTFCIGK